MVGQQRSYPVLAERSGDWMGTGNRDSGPSYSAVSKVLGPEAA